MTPQEILEYNKRCAEFLGADVKTELERIYIDNMKDDEMIFHNHSVDLKCYEWDGKKNIHYIPFEYLQFYSDWNWIMEVVEKIQSLDVIGGIVMIQQGRCKITSRMVGDNTVYADVSHYYLYGMKKQKEATVEAINQFLIWYEQNKIA